MSHTDESLRRADEAFHKAVESMQRLGAEGYRFSVEMRDGSVRLVVSAGSQTPADAEKAMVQIRDWMRTRSECQDGNDNVLGPLRALAILVPRRLWEEEIGDALECICMLESTGAPRWQITLKKYSAVFWVLINTVREVVSAALGRAKSGR